MKPIAFATVAVLTGWMSASAQQPKAAQQTASPPNEPAHKIYVMSGCLEIESGSTSAFRLTRAQPVGQAPPSAGTATSKDDRVYELQPVSNFGEQGISRDRLKSHVGKRVEVTVRPVDVAPAPASPPRPTDGAEKKEQPPRYTVVMINQLADSCQ
jgi:hypothetical protein